MYQALRLDYAAYLDRLNADPRGIADRLRAARALAYPEQEAAG